MIQVREREIWITGKFWALHRWADCPFEEVSFLRNWHRHVFHVKLTYLVTHADRELEFFVVQQRLRYLLQELEGKQHDNSCEMFAEYIGEEMRKRINAIPRSVEVSEDGENGAIVYFYSKC